MPPPPPIPPLPVSSSSGNNYHFQQHHIMDVNQFKQLSAPSLGTSSAIATTLSSSANGGSSGARYQGQQASNFWDNYEHLCALQNLMPLQSLKASLLVDAGTNLNINADRLKFLFDLRIEQF